ncbi:NAD(P)H-hydrate dehydratase [Pseudorhodobacter sp. W20_MBD10_FR17]|uniref:NAD(P)H-hydrate dehydratase n=1 Tax=Pseudorhodobacter sp. W20_MBD10_FR17 TaxID=3240266 RepID=UPI003F993C8E
MTELLTAAQMRAIEVAAIESGQVTGLELMERAGQGVVQAIFDEWPELRAAPNRAVVLCGPGNNGGDGFVVARLLKGLGWEVRVLAAAAADSLPKDAAENARAWSLLGATEALTEKNLRSGVKSDLYVDAIFGTGLSRPPRGDILQVLTHLGGRNGDIAYYQSRLVAVDAPSGLCMDSGRMLIGGWAVPTARLTVTFDSLKAGHLLEAGPELCGKVVVQDIGIGPWRDYSVPRQVSGEWCGAVRPVPLGLVQPVDGSDSLTALHPGSFRAEMLGKRGGARAHAAHKYAYGHALILSGGITSGGAARLAARGALRIGAGLVTLGCPPSAVITNAAQLNAIMLKAVEGAAALEAVLQDARINALCLGPGLGTGVQQGELVAAALGHGGGGPRPTVLDADALTLLAENADLFAMVHKNCVLTPHAGEFARLFPDIAAKLAEPATKGPAFSKVDATRQAAKRAGCVVLFKGPDTVIAAPDGRCAINAAVYDRTAPWLATAGSGDVLAGFITGLMARGLAPMQAAEAGAWLHVECARSFGPGLIAEDLPEELPKVFCALDL